MLTHILAMRFLTQLYFILFTTVVCTQTNKETTLLKRLTSFSADVSTEEIEQQLKNTHTIAKKDLANFYVALANYQQVIFRDYKKANENYYLALAQPVITPYTKADALNGIGAIYSYYFHNDLAIRNYKKALFIIKQNYPDSLTDINSIYSNLGHTFSKENQMDSAKYYFRKGILLGKKYNKPAMGAYFNLGNVLKNVDSSYYYTYKALEAAYEIKQDYLLTFCFLNLGSIEVNRNNLKAADSLLELSKVNAIKYKQIQFINEIDIQKGRSLIAKGESQKGIDLLLTVEDYFIKANDFKQLETIYIHLERAYIQTNNYKKAHAALKKYYEVLNNRENSKKLKQAEGNQLYKSLEKQLEQENKKRNSDKSFYSIIISILIIVIAFVVYFFVKHRKRLQQKNRSIKNKNENLSLKLGSLEDEQLLSHQQLLFKNLLVDEKQSFLKQLAEETKTLAQNANATNKKIFLDLYKKIHQNIKEDIGNEFEFHFNKVHPNFHKSLIQKEFNLSKNEMRLAALIKLNFNTKEISDLTKQSTNTIYVAKSRLKNKLGLGKEESLYSFLQSF